MAHGCNGFQPLNRLACSTMRVALAQLEPQLGALEENAAQVRAALAAAAARGADLAVFPELALSGYALGAATTPTALAVEELQALVPVPNGTAALIGIHERTAGGPGHNAAACLAA